MAACNGEEVPSNVNCPTGDTVSRRSGPRPQQLAQAGQAGHQHFGLRDRKLHGLSLVGGHLDELYDPDQRHPVGPAHRGFLVAALPEGQMQGGGPRPRR